MARRFGNDAAAEVVHNHVAESAWAAVTYLRYSFSNPLE